LWKEKQFEECRVRMSRHDLKNAFVSGVFKQGSEDDKKLIRTFMVHVLCRLTFGNISDGYTK